MVKTLERQISLGGIFSIYAYVCYKFISTRKSFDKKFHEVLIKKGTNYEKGLNYENFKFIQTPNEKLLFLLGIENSNLAFKNENLEIIERVIENFTPNAIVYERDLKL